MVRLALTELRKMNCDGYIFPADYYDIPGVECFRDLEAVKRHAFEKLKSYQAETADVYLNGGMSMETLAVIQAAARLDIRLNLWHYDREGETYVCQKLCWKPAVRGGEEKEAGEEMFLCRGRHWSPEEKSVFSVIPADKIFDFQWQEEQAGEALKGSRGKKVGICVSGLTSAMVSVLNAAAKEEVSVVCLHYDYDTEEYFPQDMDE